MTDVVVIGAGPAGVLAALRAAELGARTTLLSDGEFGGMAAHDGPVPVRALAYAARLMRDARQLPRYGITEAEPQLHFDHLLARVREIVHEVRTRTALRERVDAVGVTLHESCGPARFVSPHAVKTASGLELEADRFIVCTGGVSRRLDVPGADLAHTHSDAWGLERVPPSILVVGSGHTGVQIASLFSAFGSRVQLFEGGPRILRSEDADVSAAVATGFRASGVEVHEGFGKIASFERIEGGVRMNFRGAQGDGHAQASVAVVATGWVADTARLDLACAGVELSPRGTIKVDEYLRTSAPHIFAAGDVTGRLMLVPAAIEDGFVAATNAVQGPTQPLRHRVSPSGSFSHPEYAQVGLTEAKARETHDVVATTVPYDGAVRAIIEGRTLGFCKLVVDSASCDILGCHVVGDHAVETVQLAAVAMSARMRVDELARVAVSFPTYAEVLVHAAVRASAELKLPLGGRADAAVRAIPSHGALEPHA